MDEIIKKLFDKAVEGYNNSYAPYSNFKVGASLLLKNGDIINGCNVENASYGLCNCAERTTLFTTYAKGYRKDDIMAFLVVGKTNDVVSPCGACRQLMSELMNPDTPVYLANINGKIKEYKNKDLLPYVFTGDNLNE